MSNSLWNNCQKTAAYWDEEQPNWYKEIDTERLDMSDTHCCLMGQGVGGLIPEEWRDDDGCLPLTQEKDVLAVHWHRHEEHCKKLKQYWTTLINQRKNRENIQANN